MELLYLVFVRSFRESDFELYLDATQKLAAWYFALDRTNYARWLPVHLQDIPGYPLKKSTHMYIISS